MLISQKVYPVDIYAGKMNKLHAFPKQNFLSCSKLVISVTEHLVEAVDKLSTTAVVFFRSERILKCKHLYGP